MIDQKNNKNLSKLIEELRKRGQQDLADDLNIFRDTRNDCAHGSKPVADVDR